MQSRIKRWQLGGDRPHEDLLLETPFLNRALGPFTLRRRNLKTEVSLWRRIKCFLSTLRRRNLKTEVSFWARIEYFSCTFSPEEYKNTTNGRSFWICVCGKLGKRNHVIIVMSSFFKKPCFQTFFFTRKCKASVFKFFRFEERFPYALRFSLSSLWFMYKMRPVHPKFTTAPMVLLTGLLNGNSLQNSVNELFNVNYMYWLIY